MPTGKVAWEMSPSEIQNKGGEIKGMNLVTNRQMDGSKPLFRLDNRVHKMNRSVHIKGSSYCRCTEKKR